MGWLNEGLFLEDLVSVVASLISDLNRRRDSVSWDVFLAFGIKYILLIVQFPIFLFARSNIEFLMFLEEVFTFLFVEESRWMFPSSTKESFIVIEPSPFLNLSLDEDCIFTVLFDL